MPAYDYPTVTSTTYSAPWSWGTSTMTASEAYELYRRQQQMYQKFTLRPGRIIPVDGMQHHPNQENTTMILQITFTSVPTVKEQEQGKVEEIVAGPVTLAGRNITECIVKAAVQNADALKGVAQINVGYIESKTTDAK